MRCIVYSSRQYRTAQDRRRLTVQQTLLEYRTEWRSRSIPTTHIYNNVTPIAMRHYYRIAPPRVIRNLYNSRLFDAKFRLSRYIVTQLLHQFVGGLSGSLILLKKKTINGVVGAIYLPLVSITRFGDAIKQVGYTHTATDKRRGTCNKIK